MRRWKLEGVTGVACALALAAVPVAASGCGDALGWENPDAHVLASVQQEGIAGSWQIDREASDPPFRGGRMGRDGDGPAHDGPPPGDGAFGRGPGGRGPGGPMGPPPEGGRGLLTIAVAGDTVSLGHGGGRRHTVVADGVTRADSTERGTLETTARWDDESLVIVRSVPFGTLTETYGLSDDGTQLVVGTVAESDRVDEPMEHRRVYDPVTDS